jgi:hypothetical protein
MRNFLGKMTFGPRDKFVVPVVFVNCCWLLKKSFRYLTNKRNINNGNHIGETIATERDENEA